MVSLFKMKKFILFFFLSITNICFADGIDCIRVFLNGTLIHNTTTGNVNSNYSIQIGDTLTFDAWTDWSMLDGATLVLKYVNGGNVVNLEQQPNNKYGAQFIFIVREKDLKSNFNVFLNYNDSDFELRYFLNYNCGMIE